MKQRYLVLIALVILITGIAVYQYTLPPTLHGSVITPPKPMPDFTLSSINGPIHLSDFKGKVTVIFFGFTNCEDVCPATMAKMSSAFDKLGDKANDVRLIFISVDYKRDTPPIASAYASKFRPDFMGLTGSQAEIDTVTKDYGIYYKLEEPDANGNYEVEHYSDMMVLDRQGQLEMTWSAEQQPDDIAADLSVLVKK